MEELAIINRASEMSLPRDLFSLKAPIDCSADLKPVIHGCTAVSQPWILWSRVPSRISRAIVRRRRPAAFGITVVEMKGTRHTVPDDVYVRIRGSGSK